MRTLLPLSLFIGTLALAGCDNQTAEGRRWDQVSKDLNGKEPVQPWQEARVPWRNEHHREGTPW